jgi:hypothetical protein
MNKRIVISIAWLLVIAAAVWAVRSMHVMEAIRRMHEH